MPSGPRSADAVIREVRIVPIAGSTCPPPGLVDLRIRDGVVLEVGTKLKAHPGEAIHEGHGRWALPGLWDAHVHMGQWSASTVRLDLTGTTNEAEARAVVAHHVATLPPGEDVIVGFGHRTATWPTQPTVAALDEVSGEHAVVLISGDAHHAWMNTRALTMLGLPPHEGVVVEQEWFDVFPMLAQIPSLAAKADEGYRRALQHAASRGVVGVVDLEFAVGYRDWPLRFAGGPGRPALDLLRVRTATYPDGLAGAIEAGLASGDPLDGCEGLVTMGPLKIITDGSLNTRTAYCCEPFADGDELPEPCGTQNVAPHELRELLTQARAAGLEVAVHALGDAAVRDALDAMEITGARGTIEHAQLMRWEDIPRMGALGVRASVQPAHLWDDRDVSRQCWPDRIDRCFPFRSMLASGVTLALGSDAPVSPLDPWMAMAAGVHRSNDERPPWIPQQAMTVAEALAASLDGQGTVGVGSRGDVVLLDQDPLLVPEDSREACEALLSMQVAATFLAGRLTYSG
ncbi:amidohydrolase [Gephyromycinifex aptenodytis]|uniref:amidohydrolase n=1 Tax=Gephyromycinifex aptenodytis TaxID=2716227 RepID=UPI00144567A1|nr:amidohydrolase [Gephyromycinifex aptenodytis]